MRQRRIHPDYRTPTFLVALCLALVAARSGGAQEHPVVPGWQAVYTDPGEYRIGAEPLRRTGGAGLLGIAIASTKPSPDGSALLIQSIRADAYRGHRIRFAAWVRTTDVSGQSGLFARVDGGGIVQTSDYMLGRTIDGTTKWMEYAVVLDVPRDAVGITFGLQLTGSGEFFADDASFEAVDGDVAATGGRGHVIFPQALGDNGKGNGNGNGNGKRNGNGKGNANGVMQAGRVRAESNAQRQAQERAYLGAPLHPTNLDFENVSSIVNR